MSKKHDAQLIIDRSDVLMRTAQHPDMNFSQFIIAPFLGDGSPVDQTFWIDNSIVATGRIGIKPPVASTGLVVE